MPENLLDTLNETRPTTTDPKAPLEEAQYRDEYYRIKIEKHKEDLRQKTQDREERKKYAENIFVLICLWLVTIFLIVLGKGLGILDVSDSVIITIFTTTTANILGLMILVMKYLFPSNPPKK